MKFRRSKHPVLPWQRSLDLDVHAKRSRLEFTQERMAEYLEISVGEYKLIESYGHVPKTSYFLLICWKLQLNPLCYLKQALKQEARDVSVLGEIGRRNRNCLILTWVNTFRLGSVFGICEPAQIRFSLFRTFPRTARLL